MPIFYIRREFFEALLQGKKKAEVRVGDFWAKLAEKIRDKKVKPLAIFRCGSKVLPMEIYKVEVYPSIKRALANGRWRLLGLKANTYPEAVDEVRKLYTRGAKGPTVIFWIRKLRNYDLDAIRREMMI